MLHFFFFLFYRRFLLSGIRDSTDSSQQRTHIHLPSRSILEALLRLWSKPCTQTPRHSQADTAGNEQLVNTGAVPTLVIQNPAVNLSNHQNEQVAILQLQCVTVWEMKNILTCHVLFFPFLIPACSVLYFDRWRTVILAWHGIELDLIFAFWTAWNRWKELRQPLNNDSSIPLVITTDKANRSTCTYRLLSLALLRTHPLLLTRDSLMWVKLVLTAYMKHTYAGGGGGLM